MNRQLDVGKKTFPKDRRLKYRVDILRCFSIKWPGSNAERAKLLTSTAINKGYIESRDPISGAALGKWLKSREAPAWATLSALSLLLTTGWKPSTDSERKGVFAIIDKAEDPQEFIDQIDPEILHLCKKLYQDDK